MPNRWPKALPTLTPEQERIREDFHKQWLQTLPRRFGLIEQFNQRYPLRTFTPGARTLEIGVGLGAHLQFEDLAQQEYVALDLRAELVQPIRAAHPAVRVLVGDCQTPLDLPTGYFDRVLAIHVLEHLPDLPQALEQVRRILKPEGVLTVVIPCEGGLAYTLARNLSARPLFERLYHQKYDWFVAAEHINLPDEIFAELRARFRITHQMFFPLFAPVVTLNLAIGLTLTPLPTARV